MRLMLSEDKKCGGGCIYCPAAVRIDEDVSRIGASTLSDETAKRIRRLSLLPEFVAEPHIIIDLASGLSQRLVDILDQSGLLMEQKRTIVEAGIYFTSKNLWLQRGLFLNNCDRLFRGANISFLVPNNQGDQQSKFDAYEELIMTGIDVVMDSRFTGRQLDIHTNINDIKASDDSPAKEILDFEIIFYQLLFNAILTGTAGEGFGERIVQRLSKIREQHSVSYGDVKIEIDGASESPGAIVSFPIQIGDYPTITLNASFQLSSSTPINLVQFMQFASTSLITNPGVHFSGDRVFTFHQPEFAHLSELWATDDEFDIVLSDAEAASYNSAIMKHIRKKSRTN